MKHYHLLLQQAGVIKQLMNEAEYLIKNYGDRGRCYPSRP